MPQERKQLAMALTQFYNQPVARVSLELLLSLLAVGFFAVFAIRPTLLTMSDLIKEIEDKRELDNQMSQKIAALSTAQSEYLQVQDQLPLLDEVLPKTPQLVRSLKIIEKAATDNNIIINGINVNELPKEVDPNAPVPARLKRVDVPITIVLTGDYLSIRQFVETLRNSRRTFVIDSIIFTLSEERGQRRLNASLTVSIPYLGADTGGRSSAAPTPTPNPEENL